MLSRYVTACALVMLATAPLLAQTDQPTDDPRVRQAIERLFQAGWDVSLEARRAADQVYDDRVVDDPRITYAYALVKIRQRQYTEALELVQQVLEAQPEDLAARRAQVWLALLLSQPQEALSGLDQLSKQVTNQAAPVDEQTRLEAPRFLGRMFGYLEGPASSATSPLLVENQQRKIIARLDPEQMVALDEGKQAVRQLYEELALEREQALAEAAEEGEARREEELREIERRREQLQTEETELNARRDRLQEDLNQALNQIAAEDTRITSALAPLEAQAAGIRRELAFLLDDIGRLQRRYEQEEDPIFRDRLLNEIDRLQRLAGFYDADLFAVQRRGSALLAQRNQLLRRRAQTQNNYGRQIEAVDNQLSDLRRQERRLRVERERLDRDTAYISRRARSLGAQAASLLTYEPFPLEQQRQRLLGGGEVAEEVADKP